LVVGFFGFFFFGALESKLARTGPSAGVLLIEPLIRRTPAFRSSKACSEEFQIPTSNQLA
jgi:hypothetical protein